VIAARRVTSKENTGRSAIFRSFRTCGTEPWAHGWKAARLPT